MKAYKDMYNPSTYDLAKIDTDPAGYGPPKDPERSIELSWTCSRSRQLCGSAPMRSRRLAPSLCLRAPCLTRPSRRCRRTSGDPMSLDRCILFWNPKSKSRIRLCESWGRAAEHETYPQNFVLIISENEPSKVVYLGILGDFDEFVIGDIFLGDPAGST